MARAKIARPCVRSLRKWRVGVLTPRRRIRVKSSCYRPRHQQATGEVQGNSQRNARAPSLPRGTIVEVPGSLQRNAMPPPLPLGTIMEVPGSPLRNTMAPLFPPGTTRELPASSRTNAMAASLPPGAIMEVPGSPPTNAMPASLPPVAMVELPERPQTNAVAPLLPPGTIMEVPGSPPRNAMAAALPPGTIVDVNLYIDRNNKSKGTKWFRAEVVMAREDKLRLRYFQDGSIEEGQWPHPQSLRVISFRQPEVVVLDNSDNRPWHFETDTPQGDDCVLTSQASASHRASRSRSKGLSNASQNAVSSLHTHGIASHCDRGTSSLTLDPPPLPSANCEEQVLAIKTLYNSALTDARNQTKMQEKKVDGIERSLIELRQGIVQRETKAAEAKAKIGQVEELLAALEKVREDSDGYFKQASVREAQVATYRTQLQEQKDAALKQAEMYLKRLQDQKDAIAQQADMYSKQLQSQKEVRAQQVEMVRAYMEARNSATMLQMEEARKSHAVHIQGIQYQLEQQAEASQKQLQQQKESFLHQLEQQKTAYADQVDSTRSQLSRELECLKSVHAEQVSSLKSLLEQNACSYEKLVQAHIQKAKDDRRILERVLVEKEQVQKKLDSKQEQARRSGFLVAEERAKSCQQTEHLMSQWMGIISSRTSGLASPQVQPVNVSTVVDFVSSFHSGELSSWGPFQNTLAAPSLTVFPVASNK